MRDMDDDEGQIISKPHNHDVLCGRGGLTNQHAGNEWFRRLVRSNRALYRSCPKHTKLLVAKAIVQAVQQQEPPGRFLEVADKDAGTWRQINYKRSVDKTSQALREKEQQPQQSQSSPVDPLESEVAQLAAQAAARKGKKHSADLSDLAQATLRQAGLEGNNGGSSNQNQQSNDQQGKRKASGMGEYFMSTFWEQGGQGGPSTDSNEYGAPQKRSRTDPDEAEAAPLPTLQARQSSTFFRFLSSSGIFGSSNKNEQGNNNYMDPMRQQSSGFFSYGGGNNDIRQPHLRPNPSDLISMEASHFEGGNASMGGGNHRQSLNNFDPLPANQGVGGSMQGQYAPDSSRMNNGMPEQYYQNMGMAQGPRGSMMVQQMGDAVPPPSNRLTSQVSDWLGSFWPLGRDGQPIQNPRDQENFQPPPPPEGNLERRASSSIFNLARSPSQFLTSLRSGVSSMFGGDDLTPVPVNQMNGRVPEATTAQAAPIIGTASASKPDSLLDDYEETPLETRLRSVTSIKPQYDV